MKTFKNFVFFSLLLACLFAPAQADLPKMVNKCALPLVGSDSGYIQKMIISKNNQVVVQTPGALFFFNSNCSAIKSIRKISHLQSFGIQPFIEKINDATILYITQDQSRYHQYASIIDFEGNYLQKDIPISAAGIIPEAQMSPVALPNQNFLLIDSDIKSGSTKGLLVLLSVVNNVIKIEKTKVVPKLIFIEQTPLVSTNGMTYLKLADNSLGSINVSTLEFKNILNPVPTAFINSNLFPLNDGKFLFKDDSTKNLKILSKDGKFTDFLLEVAFESAYSDVQISQMQDGRLLVMSSSKFIMLERDTLKNIKHDNLGFKNKYSDFPFVELRDGSVVLPYFDFNLPTRTGILGLWQMDRNLKGGFSNFQTSGNISTMNVLPNGNVIIGSFGEITEIQF